MARQQRDRRRAPTRQVGGLPCGCPGHAGAAFPPNTTRCRRSILRWHVALTGFLSYKHLCSSITRTARDTLKFGYGAFREAPANSARHISHRIDPSLSEFDEERRRPPWAGFLPSCLANRWQSDICDPNFPETPLDRTNLPPKISQILQQFIPRHSDLPHLAALYSARVARTLRSLAAIWRWYRSVALSGSITDHSLMRSAGISS